jgi:uncharacterized protein
VSGASRGPVELQIVAKPGSRKPGITRDGDLITVAVRERALEGAANAAVVRAVAAWLEVATSRVALVRGATSRRKTLAVDADPESVRERLGR